MSGVLPVIGELRAEGLPRFAEQLRRRVVRRCQPAVGETGDATKPGVGAPAPHPDRRSARLRGPGFQGQTLGRIEAADERRAVVAPQRPERADRLVEPRPTFREVETDGRVVVARRARTDGHDQPTARQTIDRAQRLGDRHRSAHHRERDRRRQRHRRPSAPSPPRARPVRRARAPRRPCGRSPTARRSRVARPPSCTQTPLTTYTPSLSREADRHCGEAPASLFREAKSTWPPVGDRGEWSANSRTRYTDFANRDVAGSNGIWPARLRRQNLVTRLYFESGASSFPNGTVSVQHAGNLSRVARCKVSVGKRNQKALKFLALHFTARLKTRDPSPYPHRLRCLLSILSCSHWQSGRVHGKSISRLFPATRMASALRPWSR